MRNQIDNLPWGDAGLLLAGLLVLGFLVSWLSTDVFHLARRTYIVVLTLVTAAATAVVAGATGLSLSSLAGHHWAAGLAAAAVAGTVGGVAIRRFPATHPLHGKDLGVVAAWEGIVYGIAEGVLLSALPLLVAWEAAGDAGWSDAAAWAVSLAASVAVIAVHHFGYWDFRGPMVFQAILGCGLLSLAFLATGSILAPALGHVILHVAGIVRGVELPPHPRPVAVSH